MDNSKAVGWKVKEVEYKHRDVWVSTLCDAWFAEQFSGESEVNGEMRKGCLPSLQDGWYPGKTCRFPSQEQCWQYLTIWHPQTFGSGVLSAWGVQWLARSYWGNNLSYVVRLAHPDLAESKLLELYIPWVLHVYFCSSTHPFIQFIMNGTYDFSCLNTGNVFLTNTTVGFPENMLDMPDIFGCAAAPLIFQAPLNQPLLGYSQVRSFIVTMLITLYAPVRHICRKYSLLKSTARNSRCNSWRWPLSAIP